ncbi:MULTISPECIES: sensor histidine kinase [unclassified Massilia]|uniref:sensor histidine kinase n=1 Tax=unclassified Massilia TaxID=2609279 RepID=UPI001B8300DD|nr:MULTISPECIES: histidine kinase [unclassified Massilia]MBQ5940471.1 histidine kinase [Massilia sp. AB1]MBQ5963616.1 histidine kinase [Massilia sp. ZL223]
MNKTTQCDGRLRPWRCRPLHGAVVSLHFLQTVHFFVYRSRMQTSTSAPILPGRWMSRDWFWAAVAWSGIGLFDAIQTLIVMKSGGMHHAWPELFCFRMLYWLVWAVATPAVLRLGMRIAAQDAQRLGWPGHLLACLGIGLLSALWTAVLEQALDPWLATPPPSWRELWRQHFVNGMLTSVVLYVTTLAIGYGVRAREGLMLERAKRAQLNEQLVQAQLDALRRQIEPHFLFNSLNTITGLVRERRNDAAVGMITGLSELLRRVLADADRNLATLDEELAFLDKYLAIQKMRFGERLHYSVDAPPALLSAQVPTLLLQPLVENAFKHGLAHRPESGRIGVTIGTAADRLSIAVYNDGPPLPAAVPAGRIGLANVRQRLASLYDGNFTLDLCNRGDGVEVRITLPLVHS